MFQMGEMHLLRSPEQLWAVRESDGLGLVNPPGESLASVPPGHRRCAYGTVQSETTWKSVDVSNPGDIAHPSPPPLFRSPPGCSACPCHPPGRCGRSARRASSAPTPCGSDPRCPRGSAQTPLGCFKWVSVSPIFFCVAFLLVSP